MAIQPGDQRDRFGDAELQGQDGEAAALVQVTHEALAEGPELLDEVSTLADRHDPGVSNQIAHRLEVLQRRAGFKASERNDALERKLPGSRGRCHRRRRRA